MKYYYEIAFYGEGHPKDWSFYFKTDVQLTKEDVKQELQNKYLGVDGLEQHHIDNIDFIQEIDGVTFTSCCSIEA